MQRSPLLVHSASVEFLNLTLEMQMQTRRTLFLSVLFLSVMSFSQQSSAPQKLAGYRDSPAQLAIDKKFNAVPDPKLAEEHLRILTAEPHIAGSIEDKKTADYVAKKFREAGLDTEILEYRIWVNLPKEVSLDITAPKGVTMHGPSPEHVSSDPYQDDPRITPAFNGSSTDADLEAEVVYANYGSPADFKKLKQLGIDVRGK